MEMERKRSSFEEALDEREHKALHAMSDPLEQLDRSLGGESPWLFRNRENGEVIGVSFGEEQDDAVTALVGEIVVGTKYSALKVRQLIIDLCDIIDLSEADVWLNVMEGVREFALDLTGCEK